MENDNWTLNGFVIQHTNDNSNYPFQDVIPYKGLGRYDSWPLFYEKDEKSKLLTHEAGDKWFNLFYNDYDDKYALAVVPSPDFLRKYIEVCEAKKIKIRIIRVETNRSIPAADEIKLETIFLGFDYVTSQSFFSVLYDDLYALEVPEKLQRFTTLLNSNGMFSCEEDLYAYVKSRDDVINDGYNLETHGDFCMMKISLIKDIQSFMNFKC